MLKKVLIWIAGVLGLLAIVIAITMGRTLQDFLTVEVIEGGPDIFYIMDYGGNSGLVIGDSIAVIIDTKMGKGTKKLKDFANEKIGDKLLVIINTHFHQDHTSGNESFDNSKIYAGDYGEEFWLEENDESSLPSDWVTENMSLALGNGQALEIIAVGQNHTYRDLFIYSPRHKTLFAGDIYTHLSHPVMKEGSKPDIGKWETTLQQYANGDLDIETVVPGHGDLAKKEDLLSMANYFSDIKTLTKKKLKQKYGKWQSLPFLAGLNKSLKYVSEYRP